MIISSFYSLIIVYCFLIIMRGRGRGRGRVNAGNTQRIVNNAIRRNERHDRGQLFSPSLLPPKYAVLPWNSYTYSQTEDVINPATAITITTDKIKTRLRNQMGLEADAIITMKVERMRVWNISVGSTTANATFAMPNLNVNYFELANGSATRSLRQEDRDHGTLNMPAKSGYVWPLGDRNEVLPSTENIQLASIYSYPGTKIVAMVNLLWRAQDNSAMFSRPPSPF